MSLGEQRKMAAVQAQAQCSGSTGIAKLRPSIAGGPFPAVGTRHEVGQLTSIARPTSKASPAWLGRTVRPRG